MKTARSVQAGGRAVWVPSFYGGNFVSDDYHDASDTSIYLKDSLRENVPDVKCRLFKVGGESGAAS
jgi:hypothetical protein